MDNVTEGAAPASGSAPLGPSPAPHTASTPPAPGVREWVCPGVPYRRRVMTGVGVVLASAVFFFLAHWQGASMLVSSIIGTIFICGFVGYLWVVAPAPFTIALDNDGIARSERAGLPARITWPTVAKVKEERFKSGKSVSLTVYKRVGERGLHRAFVVYRDDIPDFDGFLAALRSGVPDERPWLVETVHE
jgi:hypothetical protein